MAILLEPHVSSDSQRNMFQEGGQVFPKEIRVDGPIHIPFEKMGSNQSIGNNATPNSLAPPPLEMLHNEAVRIFLCPVVLIMSIACAIAEKQRLVCAQHSIYEKIIRNERFLPSLGHLNQQQF